MSIAYSSQKYRRTGLDKGSTPSKDKAMNQKVLQLKEIYPDWSNEDLDSLLREVNNDVETAVLRISEGHAEQWVSSSRKKEKRTGAGGATQGKDAHGGWDRERGDAARGARGGRAGRGGRGGSRGTGRGGHRETNGRHTASPAPKPTTQASTPTAEGTATDAWGQQVEQDTAAAWGDAASSSAPQAESEPVATSSSAAAVSVWPNGSSIEQNAYTPSAAAKSATKTPATTKMSWAQIAKPQEKPKPVVSPAPPLPLVTAPTVPPELTPSAPEPESPTQEEAQGWEGPTTVEEPTWDDELPSQAVVPDADDAWTSPPAAETTEVHPEPVETEPEPVAEPQSEPEPVSVPAQFPAQLGVQQKTESPIVPPAKPVTPVSYARSLARAGNRFKTDQAVVMPSAFGSSVEKLGMQFGSVSLGDDAPEPKAPEPAAQEMPVVTPPEPAREMPAPFIAAAEPEAPSLSPVSTTQTPMSSSQPLFQQNFPPQQLPAQPSPLLSLQNAQAASSLLSAQTPSQSSVSSQTTSTATSTPLTSFSSQQTTPATQSSISPYQQHATSHTQTQPHASQTSSQSALPSQSHLHQQFQQYPSSQLETSTNAQSPPTQQQQSSVHQSLGGHSSYFRQPGQQDFFIAPTPPAGQAQESPYGSFAPLTQQLSHQAQGSHLGGFSSDHFGYNDNQRGFYDSYGQQSGFGGRTALGHDDVGKGLPTGQQANQASNGLPQSSTQTTNQQSSQQQQGSGQPQAPTAGQPQQGYAPLPYYYNPYQASQFYGPPFTSGYGLGQYGNRYQQPPMFQPPNASSGSPANAKGPNAVQPQYAQSVYGQHTSPGYDDGYHNQLGHGHAQSLGGLPGSDYSKQLYGGQGIPGFSAGGPGGAPGLGQRGAGAGASASPENAYKPYAAGGKDAGSVPGVGSSMGAGAQGGLGAGAGGAGARGAGVQQPQGFYGTNRYTGTPGTGGAGGPGGPGQQGHQHGQQTGAAAQASGYPQGAGVGADSSFYYQRGPAQQQYWQ